MNKRFTVSVIAASLVLACASVAFSQETKYPDIQDAKPMFKTLPNHMRLAPQAPAAAQLVQWNGTFKDLTNRTVTYTMVGTDPTTTNVASKIPVYIFPIKMVYGAANGNHTFDPKHVLSNGKTVIRNIIASPIVNHGVNFTQGGTDLGTTQYIDAFQRGNFWSSVKTNTGYHVVLGSPTVLPEQTITVSRSQGNVISNPFGSGKVGTMGINAFDSNLQTFMRNLT